MKKSHSMILGILSLCLVLPAIPVPGICAREETAHLFFDKTAYHSGKAIRHVITRGECLARILRKQLGASTAAGQRRIMKEIKDLNPSIKDLNKIYPGQVLLLPGSERYDQDAVQTATYTTRKGDSLLRIITHEMKTEPQDVYKTLQLVKQFNPEVRDVNLIYPRQTLKIPVKSAETVPQKGETPQGKAYPETTESKATTATLPQGKLSTIREVLGRINGTLCTTGNYYIPLPHAGQITIDCSTMPVAELDDGSAIVIDSGNRLPLALKKIIRSNWQNYTFPPVGEADSIAAILQKIIKSSKSYTMTKSTKPLVVGTSPQNRVLIDWIISRKTPRGTKSIVQGLSFLKDDSQMLPAAMRAYMEKNGISVTEITEDGSIVRKMSQTAMCEPSALGIGSSCELAFSLLALLGYAPTRNVEVKVYDKIKDGFNLSIVADLLVSDGQRKVMILVKEIPIQFSDILKTSGTEVLSFSEAETRRGAIEKTLTVMRIPFMGRTFSFSFAGSGTGSRAMVSFPAIQILRGETPFYLVDFDMDPGINCLLREHWAVVKY